MRDTNRTMTTNSQLPCRRSLVAAARRRLWDLLRGEARKVAGGIARSALRRRLGDYVRRAPGARLAGLLRSTALAGAVAVALAGGAPGAAQEIEYPAVELAGVAAGRGGFAVEGKGRLASGTGYSVANAGDVNGDGIPDAIVAGLSCLYNGCFTKPSYVVFGRTEGAPIDLEAVSLGQGGFAIRGQAGWGASVSGAGDVNGDGLADVLIGAPSASPEGRTHAGESYVVFGKQTSEAVELSEIALGQGGFAILGSAVRDYAGSSVAGAGDVNGDGLADVIVGGPGGHYAAGTSYVVFGKRTSEAVELSEVALGQGGFVIRGEREGDRAGSSVSGTGDVNGDGLADLLVGAPGASPEGRRSAGETYVVFGKRTREAVELSEVALGQGGFVIRGEREGDRAGSSVSGTGDVNGDGLADLLVGAPGASPEGRRSAGEAYVVFGKQASKAVELSEVALGQGGFVVRGMAYDSVGTRVAGAGDVNGDGLADLVVVAYYADRERSIYAGQSYVVFGKRTSEAVELAEVALGQGGFVILRENELDRPHVQVVLAVSGAGDVNGDGLADILIGVWGRPRGSNFPVRESFVGASYLVFGKRTTEAIKLSEITLGQGGHTIRGYGELDYSTLTVSSVGDLNGDGLEDLLIGAPDHSPGGREGTGASFVVFGKTSSEAIEIENVAAGEGGFAIRGRAAGDHSGVSVSGAGDLNGDGLADLLIGAPSASPGGRTYAGESYVVFGKRTSEAVELAEVALGQGGFVIRGELERDRSGSSVSGIGDLNGDGLADLLIGAPTASPGGRTSAGESYVVLGKRTSEAVELSEVALGRGGFVIRGEIPGDGSGSIVSGAGDVNGDGLADLLIGAPRTSPGGRTYAGESYVVFGKRTSNAVELSAVTAGQGGFVIRGELERDRSGTSVSGAGDLNGDGLMDLLVGAPGGGYGEERTHASASYMVFGRTKGEPVELSEIALGQGGFVIRSASMRDRSGSSVAGAGDVNGDGIPDLAIGTGFFETIDVDVDGKAYVVFGPRREGAPYFHRGDPNLSGDIDISDGIAIFGYLFLGNPAKLSCIESADANNDATIDISDGIYLLEWLFTGGPEPPAPGPTKVPCGFDPDPPGSPGDLGCGSYDHCN